jgi:hypothetical protein
LVHVREAQNLGWPEAYPLGVGILKITEGKGPDFEKRIVTQLKDDANRR